MYIYELNKVFTDLMPGGWKFDHAEVWGGPLDGQSTRIIFTKMHDLGTHEYRL